MDNAKFWSHIYHQKEVPDNIKSLLSGLVKPFDLFIYSVLNKKLESFEKNK